MNRPSLRSFCGIALGVTVAMGGGTAPLLAANAPPVILAGPQMDQLTANAVGASAAGAFQPGQVNGPLGQVNTTPDGGFDDTLAAKERLISGQVPNVAPGGSNTAKSDAGTVTSGTVSRSVTSSGPGTTATSSATASGSGTSSVFVSSMTTSTTGANPFSFSPLAAAPTMPSFATSVPTPVFAGR